MIGVGTESLTGLQICDSCFAEECSPNTLHHPGLPELADKLLKCKIKDSRFYQPSAVDVVVGPGVRQRLPIRQAFPGVCSPTPWECQSSSDTLVVLKAIV